MTDERLGRQLLTEQHRDLERRANLKGRKKKIERKGWKRNYGRRNWKAGRGMIEEGG